MTTKTILINWCMDEYKHNYEVQNKIYSTCTCTWLYTFIYCINVYTHKYYYCFYILSNQSNITTSISNKKQGNGYVYYFILHVYIYIYIYLNSVCQLMVPQFIAFFHIYFFRDQPVCYQFLFAYMPTLYTYSTQYPNLSQVGYLFKVKRMHTHSEQVNFQA